MKVVQQRLPSLPSSPLSSPAPEIEPLAESIGPNAPKVCNYLRYAYLSNNRIGILQIIAASASDSAAPVLQLEAANTVESSLLLMSQTAGGPKEEPTGNANEDSDIEITDLISETRPPYAPTPKVECSSPYAAPIIHAPNRRDSSGRSQAGTSVVSVLLMLYYQFI